MTSHTAVARGVPEPVRVAASRVCALRLRRSGQLGLSFTFFVLLEQGRWRRENATG